MSYQTLIYKKENGIAIVTLNRPQRRNAINTQMAQELGAVFEEIAKDEAVRVVILTGGEAAFSAGADIKEMESGGALRPVLAASRKHNFFTRIEDLEKPVIAAISGPAVGGGCELALVCDLRLASHTARFGFGEVKIGIIPDAGGTVRLPRLIGATLAKELLFFGDLIDAQEAYRLGLVNRVVPVESLMEEAKRMAQTLLVRPPLALKMIKACVNDGLRMDLAAALEYEGRCADSLLETEDRKEGIRAFIEKRKPTFTGR